MKHLGSEVVFNLRAIKNHYDALGSYLHSPSLKSINSGAIIDYRKMRMRCEEIASLMKKVLASSVFNSTFGVFLALIAASAMFVYGEECPLASTTLRLIASTVWLATRSRELLKGKYE